MWRVGRNVNGKDDRTGTVVPAVNGVAGVQPVRTVGVAAVVGLVAALMVVVAYSVIGGNQSINNERTSVYNNLECVVIKTGTC